MTRDGSSVGAVGAAGVGGVSGRGAAGDIAQPQPPDGPACGREQSSGGVPQQQHSAGADAVTVASATEVAGRPLSATHSKPMSKQRGIVSNNAPKKRARQRILAPAVRLLAHWPGPS